MNEIFLLILLFQAKHFLADYLLQTTYMLGKFRSGTAWILPLLAHSGVHAGFTLAILLCFRPDLALQLALLDLVVHFIIDRIKASPSLLGRFKAMSPKEFKNHMVTVNWLNECLERALQQGDYEEAGRLEGYLAIENSVSKSNKMFWIALGADQFFHHLTHYFIIWSILQ